MNQKVENPKTEVPTSINMNDKDMLNALLEVEKNMSVNMTIALNEASNETLYKELFQMFESIKNKQREIFELAFKKGWYSLEKAEEQKITTAYNKHTNCIKELDPQTENMEN
ncbi:MAG: spore coat protein [Bacilli bacterium]|nr:spore coat protein [Bacilli bacterium]